jgi:FKBP-type peptidyl-prolyl cis-trans isomerase FklB
MKKSVFTVFVMGVSVLFMASCGQKSGDFEFKTHNDSVSYVIGANIGANVLGNITRDSLDLNHEALVQGFKDALAKIDTVYFTNAQKQEIMFKFQQDMQQQQMDKQMKAAVPNKEAGTAFLAENKKKEGVIETASGLQYKVIKEGTGKKPTAEDVVTVHYEGKLLDNTIFDSSYDRKEPATFPLNGVIKGWTEGLQLMKEGGIYELYIPSDLAYGDMGNQGIPGGSTLIFKVELIKVGAQQQTQPGK